MKRWHDTAAKDVYEPGDGPFFAYSGDEGEWFVKGQESEDCNIIVFHHLSVSLAVHFCDRLNRVVRLWLEQTEK